MSDGKTVQRRRECRTTVFGRPVGFESFHLVGWRILHVGKAFVSFFFVSLLFFLLFSRRFVRSFGVAARGKKKQKTKKKQTKRFLSAPGRFAYGDRSHRHHHRHHQIEAVLFFFFFIFCLDRNDRRTSANATLTSRGVDSFRFSHRAAIKSETTTTTFRVEETRDNNETAESSWTSVSLWIKTSRWPLSSAVFSQSVKEIQSKKADRHNFPYPDLPVFIFYYLAVRSQ